jgi:hypothetical protein
VNHSAGEYLHGPVHTRRIEGFWALFKRGSYGIYHRMTGEHLHRYWREFTGRAGIRGTDTMDQMECLIRRRVGEARTYKSLTA